MQISTIVINIGCNGSCTVFNTNSCTGNIKTSYNGVVIHHDVTVLMQMYLSGNSAG
ncbi:hypothetical protein DSECCO2_295420 [anaerobic digester metagenome]